MRSGPCPPQARERDVWTVIYALVMVCPTVHALASQNPKQGPGAAGPCLHVRTGHNFGQNSVWHKDQLCTPHQAYLRKPQAGHGRTACSAQVIPQAPLHLRAQLCPDAGVTGAHHMRSMDAWLPPWRLNQSEKETASSARTSRMPPSGSNSARTMGDVPSASELATCARCSGI